jgi:hypothetical protein
VNIFAFFDWLCGIFHQPKDLSAIQKVWEQTEHDLSGFMDRTQAKREALQAEIDALTEMHAEETVEKDKASIFLGNLQTLRTQSINLVASVVTPAVTEPVEPAPEQVDMSTFLGTAPVEEQPAP